MYYNIALRVRIFLSRIYAITIVSRHLSINDIIDIYTYPTYMLIVTLNHHTFIIIDSITKVDILEINIITCVIRACIWLKCDK